MSENQMTLYDINKQVVSQMEVLDPEGYIAGKDKIRAFALSCDNTHYMLMCRELNYYTVFKLNPLIEIGFPFEEEVIDCVEYVGAPKAIDYVEGAVEIWVHPVCEEPVAMYLFPYDEGVIECAL